MVLTVSIATSLYSLQTMFGPELLKVHDWISLKQGCCGVGTCGNGVSTPFLLREGVHTPSCPRLHWNMAAISQMC